MIDISERAKFTTISTMTFFVPPQRLLFPKKPAASASLASPAQADDDDAPKPRVSAPRKSEKERDDQVVLLTGTAAGLVVGWTVTDSISTLLGSRQVSNGDPVKRIFLHPQYPSIPLTVSQKGLLLSWVVSLNSSDDWLTPSGIFQPAQLLALESRRLGLRRNQADSLVVNAVHFHRLHSVIAVLVGRIAKPGESPMQLTSVGLLPYGYLPSSNAPQAQTGLRLTRGSSRTGSNSFRAQRPQTGSPTPAPPSASNSELVSAAQSGKLNFFLPPPQLKLLCPLPQHQFLPLSKPATSAPSLFFKPSASAADGSDRFHSTVFYLSSFQLQLSSDTLPTSSPSSFQIQACTLIPKRRNAVVLHHLPDLDNATPLRLLHSAEHNAFVVFFRRDSCRSVGQSATQRIHRTVYFFATYSDSAVTDTLPLTPDQCQSRDGVLVEDGSGTHLVALSSEGNSVLLFRNIFKKRIGSSPTASTSASPTSTPAGVQLRLGFDADRIFVCQPRPAGALPVFLYCDVADRLVLSASNESSALTVESLAPSASFFQLRQQECVCEVVWRPLGKGESTSSMVAVLTTARLLILSANLTLIAQTSSTPLSAVPFLSCCWVGDAVLCTRPSQLLFVTQDGAEHALARLDSPQPLLCGAMHDRVFIASPTASSLCIGVRPIGLLQVLCMGALVRASVDPVGFPRTALLDALQHFCSKYDAVRVDSTLAAALSAAGLPELGHALLKPDYSVPDSVKFRLAIAARDASTALSHVNDAHSRCRHFPKLLPGDIELRKQYTELAQMATDLAQFEVALKCHTILGNQAAVLRLSLVTALSAPNAEAESVLEKFATAPLTDRSVATFAAAFLQKPGERPFQSGTVSKMVRLFADIPEESLSMAKLRPLASFLTSPQDLGGLVIFELLSELHSQQQRAIAQRLAKKREEEAQRQQAELAGGFANFGRRFVAGAVSAKSSSTVTEEKPVALESYCVALVRSMCHLSGANAAQTLVDELFRPLFQRRVSRAAAPGDVLGWAGTLTQNFELPSPPLVLLLQSFASLICGNSTFLKNDIASSLSIGEVALSFKNPDDVCCCGLFALLFRYW
eukprot:TRINITY_DN3428_c0_g1_i1.p1 TRINITY_DN3428_c0_g1~~TRINITY_DN3428_c0_g1_i1.p1  ORF type:complete len:1262 (+),score=310.63 TRINITY_DN3428_c0_g1_i1:543-3788(+)